MSTVVWRVMMPDQPAPVRGTTAGIVSAFGTVIVLGVLQGFLRFLRQIFAGVTGDPVTVFIVTFATIAIWGTFLAAVLIVPLGVIGGYSYEQYLAVR